MEEAGQAAPATAMARGPTAAAAARARASAAVMATGAPVEQQYIQGGVKAASNLGSIEGFKAAVLYVASSSSSRWGSSSSISPRESAAEAAVLILQRRVLTCCCCCCRCASAYVTAGHQPVLPLLLQAALSSLLPLWQGERAQGGERRGGRRGGGGI